MLTDRILGVLKLNVDTFEEIEADESATSQAALVVLIVAIISAVGSGISGVISDTGFFGSFFSTLLTTFVGWLLWSAITYFVGTSLFEGEADLGEMLRVIGFSYAPQILGIIPCVGGIIGAIWSLVCGFIAVRQGLDLDDTKAFLTIIVGFIGYVVVMLIFGAIFGGGMLALGALTGS
jgi:hypothetical protein